MNIWKTTSIFFISENHRISYKNNVFNYSNISIIHAYEVDGKRRVLIETLLCSYDLSGPREQLPNSSEELWSVEPFIRTSWSFPFDYPQSIKNIC